MFVYASDILLLYYPFKIVFLNSYLLTKLHTEHESLAHEDKSKQSCDSPNPTPRTLFSLKRTFEILATVLALLDFLECAHPKIRP